MIHTEAVGGVTIVAFENDRLDALTFKEFKAEAQPLLTENAHLLLDISSLKFIDSTGLGAILSVLRDLKAIGGDLKICSPLPAIEVLFELVRMQKIIDVYATREEALSAFDG